MIRRLLAVAGISLICCGCSNQDSSTVVTSSRQVANFNTVEAGGVLDLDVIAGNPQQVTVECNENSIGRVHTVVTHDVLKIYIDNNVNPEHLAVHILMPELKRLNVSGATEARVTGLKEDRCEISTSGASKVKVTGEVKDLKIDSSGAAEIKAQDLRTRNCKVAISGAGNIELYASDSVDATVTGAGKIKILGNPPKVDQHVTGVGTIEKI